MGPGAQHKDFSSYLNYVEEVLLSSFNYSHRVPSSEPLPADWLDPDGIYDVRFGFFGFLCFFFPINESYTLTEIYLSPALLLMLNFENLLKMAQ